MKGIARLSVGLAIMASGLPALGAAQGAISDATINVPVLAADVVAGEVLDKGKLVVHPIAQNRVFASTVTDTQALIGKQVTRSLPAGSPINRLHIKDVPMVAKDSAVSLVFKRPGLELNGMGKALEDGMLGQTIKVLNPETRSTLMGTVIEPGVVEIK